MAVGRDAGGSAVGLGAVGRGAVDNTVSGGVFEGAFVQAGSIDQVHVHAAPAPAPPPAPLTPRQIRAPRAVFVNRQAEIAALNEALHEALERSADRPVVVTCTGLGGVGKTELVAQWAHQRRERFPDGQLYADLGAVRRAGGVDLGEVLGGFVRALGVREDFIPASLGERANLYRTVTADRRLLVFLDGVEHAAEARALTPSSGLVVAAGRTRLEALVLEGARPVAVGPLSADAGSELVRCWLGEERGSEGELLELVRLCGGLPLALQAVGAQMITRSRMRMGRVVAELAERQRNPEPFSAGEAGAAGGVGGVGSAGPVSAEQAGQAGQAGQVGGREAGVEEAFESVYAHLSDPARELYYVIGTHPGPLFTPELARAAGVRSVEQAVEELLHAHLIDESVDDDSGEDRYRAHDLVRLHARRRAHHAWPPEQRELVLRQIVAFYRDQAAAADRQVLGKRFRLQPAPDAGSVERAPTGRAAALAWLQAERGNLLAVLHTAADRGWHEEVWQLCESLWALYHSRKHFADWIESHRLGVEAAQWEGRADAEIRMRNQLARAHYEMADYPAAQEQLDLAQEKLGLVGDPRLAGVLWESQGLLRLAQSDPEQAVRDFGEALAANAGDPHGLVVQSYNLAQALLAAGRHAEALRVLDGAVAAAEDGADEPMLMRLALVRARVLHATGESAEALAAARDAVAIAAELGQIAKEAQAVELVLELATGSGDTAVREAAETRRRQLRREAGVAPRDDPAPPNPS
ncbi:NB-ARC domain-containing protein [Streptacidiphilus cavernicola]|uniref:NB-ARC domain-containing protein n=1 Tax=Streptacidiphilus cavernicola TaxID=3342716 RepID=A0ABV6VWH7_9ACTN